MTLANVSDVAIELGQPTPTETTVILQWNAWLARAERAIRVKIPDLDTLVAADPVYGQTVADVEVAAVARVARNPEGLRTVSATVDDGTVQKTRDQGLSDGQLRILDEEWSRILPRRVPGAFSVRPQWG